MAKFTPHTDKDVKDMLSAIGASSVESLFADIAKYPPASFKIPAGKTEYEARAILGGLAEKNNTSCVSFLGGGYYDHFIPAAVDAISSRSEFYTAYTPYQPEASQGTLRAIFEYQTMIANITGMDYANASLYDGGTALYEAIAMAVRTNNRTKILIDGCVNPLFRKIINTYIINLELEIVEIPPDDIYSDKEKINSMIDGDTAALVVQSPNFFGAVEDYVDLFSFSQSKGAVNILVFYPMSLGILKTPAEMKADIAVGEGQSLGMPLSFGGPYLGVLALDKKYIRKMPGRIVGETVDKEGRRAYVLTLQAREQHIRREKATSNICSNQALCALRAVAYLALLGKDGFRNAALLNLERTEYLKQRLKAIKIIKIKKGPTFNEFTVELPVKAETLAKKMITRGYLAGLPASLFYNDKNNCLIVSATEKRTEKEIDDFASALKKELA